MQDAGGRVRLTLEMTIDEAYALVALAELGAAEGAPVRTAAEGLLRALDAALVGQAWGKASPRARRDTSRARPRADVSPAAAGTAVAPKRAAPPLVDTFAADVLRVARSTPSQWSGRAFVSDVYQRLRVEPSYARLSLEGFKGRLVAEQRAGRIVLGRAEMPQFLPEEELRA